MTPSDRVLSEGGDQNQLPSRELDALLDPRAAASLGRSEGEEEFHTDALRFASKDDFRTGPLGPYVYIISKADFDTQGELDEFMRDEVEGSNGFDLFHQGMKASESGEVFEP